MPQHRTLPPIVQKRGLVQNLLDQLGMVGPWRWQLVESIQPVVIVAEQAPSEIGWQYAWGADVFAPVAQTPLFGVFNPADSGKIIEVEAIGAIVDAVTAALSINISTSGIAGAAQQEWRRPSDAGAPVGIAAGAVTGALGTIVSYQEANTDAGGWPPVRNVAYLEPGRGLNIRCTGNLTGSFWASVYWRERAM